MEAHLRLRVLPALGHRKLSSMDRVALQDFIDAMLADGLSPALIEATCSPLRAIFARAVERNQLALNPTTDLRLPANHKRRERVATRAEAEALIGALRSPADRAMWATLIYAGLRRGEAMALRAEDVDLTGGAITVSGSWDLYAGRGPTKNGKSRRVPIVGKLRPYLAEHLLALPWGGEGLAFGTSATKPFSPTVIAFRARRDWEGLTRITPHEARHSYASLMIAAGVNMKVLSEYMGHSSISITLDRYGHLLPEAQAESVAAMDSYLDAGSA
jgi:integrase